MAISQSHLSRLQLRAAHLVRDFYEALLLLALGLLLQWNELHPMLLLNAREQQLAHALPEPQPFNWSFVCFSSGLMLRLLQYRPHWLRRSAGLRRKLLLLLELATVLYVLDYVQLLMWQPCLDIFDQALHALAHAKWHWLQLTFQLCANCHTWLINDAFYTLRFVGSLTFLLLALDKTAPKWRLALDYLLLGQLPDHFGKQRLRRRRRLLKLLANKPH
ncbi:Andorra [Drosophila busckii]|uniref:Andorra n=1 Tax=Drosophila busckii TaxID=30019 RepID=A0A0M3QZK6_DROBS|nr:uncharacterized protein LOC108606907 [Drosophila busckii]ALC49583.1 Andorra [Drosophila busckii]